MACVKALKLTKEEIELVNEISRQVQKPRAEVIRDLFVDALKLVHKTVKKPGKKE